MNNIKNQLLELSDTHHKKFTASLIPNVDNILGIKLPELRKIAQLLAKEGWQEYLELDNKEYFEETMIEGLTISYLKLDIDEHLKYVKNFIPKINNWAVCDSFCNSLKFTKKNYKKVWDFINSYLESKNEYDLRFVAVMYLSFYINDQYIDDVLNNLNNIKNEGYYVKMAVAWALSVCFVKFPKKTMIFLENNNLDDFTFNKSLQKITESFRVDKPSKFIIKSMMRK